ncbi:tyrosine-type recombinase/integrase [Salipiger sp.]|uniref:tyrosine-type recombinase/integrase n=1 Tax=Salipiger sp. TaxID=2078585 RepID=UPI003A96CDB8
MTAIAIRKGGDGKYFDGGGLSLVKAGERGKWVFRYSHLGRRREMGLGAWPDMSLADARTARNQWAATLSLGKDPIQEREAAQAAEVAERDRYDPTFAEMVDTVFEAKKAGLRGGGDRGRWRSPLDTHIIPRIGQRRMSDLTQMDLRDALKPIWKAKHPTAIKAWSRIRIVFEEARYAGIACDPFTADAAKRLLGEVRHKPAHIPSTPWRDAPALWEKLNPALPAGLCLRWMLLTLVRFDGCRGAHLGEIEGDVWTVPADRVKGREGQVEDFRVPLSRPAMDIVREARKTGDGLLFTSLRGRAVTSRGVEVHLDRIKEAGRPHGFRSTFRSWVQDTESCSFEVAETVLGHAVGSRVVRSYARSDLLDRRRTVMEAWGRFVTGQASADVVPITKGRS